ncbi:hypothetical protein QQF64_012789 [Cirrhinus molitorella]|uniref:Uncharacterized protein n=1 Tax=Cirrhinus molitorella TaxID=172907 RepID=A0ABR3LZM7_9TELE
MCHKSVINIQSGEIRHEALCCQRLLLHSNRPGVAEAEMRCIDVSLGIVDEGEREREPEIIKTRDAEEDGGLEVNEEALGSQQTSEPRLT